MKFPKMLKNSWNLIDYLKKKILFSHFFGSFRHQLQAFPKGYNILKNWENGP